MVCAGYATFCALGGCDPTDQRAQAAGLPGIDSKDLTSVIMGTNTTTPHAEMVLSALPPSPPGIVSYFGLGEGMIRGKWKLITGTQLPGPFGSSEGHPRCDNMSAFPNTLWGPQNPGVACNCDEGCLYDLEAVRCSHAHDLGSCSVAVLVTR